MVQVPEHVETAIIRALARDPGERFASAHDFAEALGGAPVRAPAPAPVPTPSPAAEVQGKKGCAAAVFAAFALGITAAGLLAVRRRSPNQKPASDTAVEGSEVVIKEFASFDDAKKLSGTVMP